MRDAYVTALERVADAVQADVRYEQQTPRLREAMDVLKTFYGQVTPELRR